MAPSQVWTSAWILIWRQWSWHWEGKTLSHLTISVFVATISDTTFSLTVWISTLFLLMILLVWRSRNPLLGKQWGEDEAEVVAEGEDEDGSFTVGIILDSSTISLEWDMVLN
jgi:hypothetical protein